MFRVMFFVRGAGGAWRSDASSIWVDETRGGSDAGRPGARGIRGEADAFLIYDAS